MGRWMLWLAVGIGLALLPGCSGVDASHAAEIGQPKEAGLETYKVPPLPIGGVLTRSFTVRLPQGITQSTTPCTFRVGDRATLTIVVLRGIEKDFTSIKHDLTQASTPSRDGLSGACQGSGWVGVWTEAGPSGRWTGSRAYRMMRGGNLLELSLYWASQDARNEALALVEDAVWSIDLQ